MIVVTFSSRLPDKDPTVVAAFSAEKSLFASLDIVGIMGSYRSQKNQLLSCQDKDVSKTEYELVAA